MAVNKFFKKAIDRTPQKLYTLTRCTGDFAVCAQGCTTWRPMRAQLASLTAISTRICRFGLSLGCSTLDLPSCVAQRSSHTQSASRRSIRSMKPMNSNLLCTQRNPGRQLLSLPPVQALPLGPVSPDHSALPETGTSIIEVHKRTYLAGLESTLISAATRLRPAVESLIALGVARKTLVEWGIAAGYARAYVRSVLSRILVSHGRLRAPGSGRKLPEGARVLLAIACDHYGEKGLPYLLAAYREGKRRLGAAPTQVPLAIV
jgi:hypothetical protein